MLLYLTLPVRSEESRARALARRIAAAWPALAAARHHPRTGAPLAPAVTRLELFLEALAPAAAPDESGHAIHVPPAEQWWQWVPAVRRPMRELIRAAFPPGPRYAAPYDPCGPATDSPDPESAAPLSGLAAELPARGDPAQKPTDPRLWLVLAPPLPAELETLMLATFLRAEPFARVVRVPADDTPGWLEREVDALIAGENLVTEGLVVDLVTSDPARTMTVEDETGRVTARTWLFDGASALEELYASREEIAPGEVYNRLHSHSASEELYIVLEGEGTIRVNERSLPIRGGQCFGKPRGYDCCTQLVNTGTRPLVFLDVGTIEPAEVDLCHYPEHGELFARQGGQRWLVPTDAILPGAALWPVYDRRYARRSRAGGGQ